MPVKIKALFSELNKTGWELDRISGSHHIFVHPKAKRPLPVPVHGKELPDFYARNILKQAIKAVKDRPDDT